MNDSTTRRVRKTLPIDGLRETWTVPLARDESVSANG